MTVEFYDWKRHPITQEVFLAIQERIIGLKEELASSAGIDSSLDTGRRYAIQAFQDILDLELEVAE